MVDTFMIMKQIKLIIMLFLFMGIAGASIIYIDSYFNLPDEISGVLYFICIGIAASGTLNHFK